MKYRKLGKRKKKVENERWKKWVLEERKKGKIWEAWKYGGEELEEWIRETCNRVWKGEGWPEGWREGIVVPIVKKGEGRRVNEYKGITLMPTLYKIYASVLAKRLREEVEK